MTYFLAASNAVMIILFVARIGRLPPQIPLFYSKPWGEEQLADLWMIVLLPLLMNGFFFLNAAVYRKFFAGDTFAKRIIDYAIFFVMFTLTAIFTKIILLIT